MLSAEPMPDVKWYVNDKEMINTPHITITYDQGVTTLTIASVIIEDTGEYTCKAVNPLGEGATKTFLRIRRKFIIFLPFEILFDLICWIIYLPLI